MRINKSFQLRAVAGEYILVNASAKTADMSKLFSLNEPAAWLWKQIVDVDFTEDMLVGLITGEYDVDEDVARKDVHDMVRLWGSFGMLTD